MIPTTTKTRIAVGGAAFIVGVWIFLFPFVGPSMGMPLVSPAHSKSTSSSSGIVFNHATVFATVVPGVVITMLGIYLVVGAFDSRRRQPPLLP